LPDANSRVRDSGPGRFKKRRPPSVATPAWATKARIRSVERQHLEPEVASQQRQLSRRVAEEATPSLQA
jgi:hypothetical protein